MRTSAAIALLSLAACADAQGLARDASCFTADECPGDQICLDNVCQPMMSTGPDSVSLEVTPPVGSRYVRTQLLDVSLAQITGPVSVSLRTPAEYQVALLERGAGGPLAAWMSIYGSPRIPGREVELTQLILGSTSRAQLFRLLEGDYSVRLSPLDPRYPAFEVTGFSVRSQAQTVMKEFQVPSRYRRLSGQIRNALTTTPVAGIAVSAVAVRTGLAATATVTDASGRYSLILPDTLDPFYELRADPPDDAQPTWSYREVLRVAEDREFDVALEPASDEVKGLAKLQILGTDGEPVGNATVEIASATVASNGRPLTQSYRLRGRTTSDGVVRVDFFGEETTEIPLINGSYGITVTPPSGSPYQTKRHSIRLASGPDGTILDEQILLRPRVTVAGQVVSASGSVVPRARLQFESAAGVINPNDAETDDQGRYQVTLDPGRYLVAIRPLGETLNGELLPTLIEALVVPESGLPNQDYRLPIGVVLNGVTDGEGEAVGGARIEVFVRVEGRTISVARATAGNDGRFSLVLAGQ